MIWFVKKLLKLNPKLPDPLVRRGNSLRQKGEIDAAITKYKSALLLKPDHPDAHYNLGIALMQQGDSCAAIKSYKKAIQYKPERPEAHINLGNALLKENDIDAAITAYNYALQLKPDHPDAHYNLGIALMQQGDSCAAIKSYKKAIQYKPERPEAHINLGNALLKENDIDAAITAYNNALQLKPDHPEAHYNLGIALMQQGDSMAAIKSYKKAILLRENYPEAYVNLGKAFSELNCAESGISAYKTAIHLNQNLADAHYNLGCEQSKIGKFNEAISAYETAISIRPDFHDALHNLGYLKLLKGDYKEGLKLYESRFKCSVYYEKNSLFFKPECERWLGETLPLEKPLLIVCEQGLGDIIQFIRYALYLKKTGISTAICAPPKLHSLIKESGIDSSPLLPRQCSSSKDQKWAPLLSLPFLLNVTPKKPLIVDPYVKTSHELTAKWRSDMKLSGEKLTIGINWEGNRSDEAKAARNFSVDYFKKMSNIADANIISLQRGKSAQEKIPPAITESPVSQQNRIHEIANSDSGEDFLQYAAVIKNCDLIITTATTLAHLAGSMGIKTWVLLPNIPDWRWGTKSDSTFWYPSVKLFRQENDNDWSETWRRVNCELKKFVEQHRALYDPQHKTS